MVVEQKTSYYINRTDSRRKDKAFYWSGKKYWRRDYQCRFHAGV